MRSRLLLALILGGCAVASHAQSITGPTAANYSSGDLLLAFYGDSAANDTVFDIGSLSAFKNANPGTTFNVASFNAAAVVAANTGPFGADVDWTVAGGNSSTGELVLSSASGSLKSSPTYTTLASTIDTIGYEVSGNAAAGTNFAVLSDKPVYNQVGANASHEWSGGPSNRADSVTTGTTSLTLWDLDSGPGNTGAAVDLGTLTLNTSTDQLTFTAAGSASTPTSGSARLVNISTRALVGSAANLLIPGFVISGSGTETVLIRAAGPALTTYGVTGVLAAPSLTLYDSKNNALASNTGWGTNVDPAQIASVSSSVGAFAFASGSADCAVIAELGPGAYTVEVGGVGQTSGIALAEVYEVSSTGTRIVNLSTRAQVGAGADEEIAGFVVAGSGTESVLARADGPSLAQYGVTDFLATPSLALETSSSQTVASNTGWSTGTGASAVAAAAATVGAFPYEAGSADSAAIVSVTSGAYTVQVTGAGGATGVALAEIYEISSE